MMIRNIVAMLTLLASSNIALAQDVNVANIEYPSSMYGEGGVQVTVESDNGKVECVAYKDGVPVGSGSAHTTARIANVSILITERKGKLSIKCM